MFELLKGQVIAAQESVMAMMTNGSDEIQVASYLSGTVNTLDRMVDRLATQKLISQAEYTFLDDMLDVLATIND